MRKIVSLIAAVALMCCAANSVEAASPKKSKKGKGKTEAVATPAPKAKGADNGMKSYKELITKEAVTARGAVTLHLVKSKLYIELPDSLMGKPMLLGGRISSLSNNRDAIAGYMPSDPQIVWWEKDKNQQVLLHQVNFRNICDTTESIYKGVKRDNVDPVRKVFPIAAIGKDSTSVLIEASQFVCQDADPFTPILKRSPFGSPLKGKYQADLSGVTGVKSFPRNAVIKTRMSFDTGGKPFTAEMTISLLQLSDSIMRPRIANRALGFFTDRRNVFSAKKDYIDQVSYINRWDLYPRPEDVEKHKRGELVVPAKQIVYYIDPSFPAEWRPWLKEGIEDWQMAFEKIGFKDAIVAKDYPTNDPSFDPDDIRYTCLRYSASDVANAMGPSWTDPRSGEIIQATVYFYHNVLSLLHNWRFVQTAAADPSARQDNYDIAVLGPLLRYLIVHEVGHTLGLMHNMRGSYAYPVDSLRSREFTDKYGTTSSIMDYARFNYIAQPGDNLNTYLPPRLGLYDYYIIKWGYSPIYEAKTSEEENPILAKWIAEKKGDPIYEYGPQGMFGPTDPAAQSESLGDDAMKAGAYGIKNLKIITANLPEWYGTKGKPYMQVFLMQKEIYNQFRRYMGHARVYLAARFDHFISIGDGDKNAYENVPTAKQKEALKFILESVGDFSTWFSSTPLDQYMYTGNETATGLQMSTIRSLTSKSSLVSAQFGYKRQVARGDKNPYSAAEYLNDIYTFVWKPTIAGTKPTWNQQRMQYAYVQSMLGALNMLEKPAAPAGIAAVEEVDIFNDPELYPYEKYEYMNERYVEQSKADQNMAPISLRNPEADVYGYVAALNLSQLQKIKSLLASRMSATGEVGDHYKYLYFEIDKALKK